MILLFLETHVLKKWYAQVHSQELGISLVNGLLDIKGNTVYKLSLKNKQDIVKQHEKLSAVFGVTVDDQNRVLPRLFAIPKLHKNPYKYRFIAGARKSSLKGISQRLHCYLQAIDTHFTNYCKKSNLHGNGHPSWQVKNSTEVVRIIKKSRKINGMITADFSTLYTSLEHDLILDSSPYPSMFGRFG